MKNKFTYLVFLLCSTILHAQSGIDSLQKLLGKTQTDTTKVRLLLQIARKYGSNDPENALKCCTQAVTITENPSYDTLIKDNMQLAGLALRAQGMSYYFVGDYTKSLRQLNRAVRILLKVNDKAGAAGAYGWIGNVYYSRADFPKALEMLLLSLKIQEGLNDKSGIGAALNGIANIYQRQHNLQKALEYYFNSLKVRRETGDSLNIAYSYNNIGLAYAEADSLTKAIEYHLKCLKLVELYGDKRGMANSFGNIGELLTRQKKYSEALKSLQRSLAISEEIADKNGISASHYDIGRVYAGMGELAKATSSFKLALRIAREIGDVDALKDIYHELAGIYARTGNYAEALSHFEKYRELKDSLMNEGSTRNLQEMQARFDTEKKEQEIQLLQKDKNIRALQMSEQEANIHRQRIIIYSVIGGLTLIITLIFFIWKSYREKKKIHIGLERKNIEINVQKNQIEEKNMLITDSIDYARNIQNAILPPERVITSCFPDSFILFMPKDIVSGDFYWLCEKEEKTFFAAIDCTGHGVPGAFMSVMAYNMLEEIVGAKNITQPSLVLDELSTMVLENLHQQSESASVKYGMDLSLIVLDKQNRKLDFAGAHNSLLVVSGEEVHSANRVRGDSAAQTAPSKSMVELKADRAAIGMAREKFTNHSIDLHQGDMLYLFTDGYPDQKGGPQNKKFLSAELKKLLADISSHETKDQKQILLETFNKWKGNNEQLDDVLVTGIRV